MQHLATWLVATEKEIEANIALNVQMKKTSFTTHSLPLIVNASSTKHTQQWKVQKLSSA